MLDETGQVVGTARRSEVRARNLRHRSVFVTVLDGTGRLLVHQRAAWKDLWPSWWDLAFGGVVAAGEDWESAARRELLEEVGVEVSHLEDLGDARYEGARVRELARGYAAVTTGPFRFADGEVVDVRWIDLVELDDWVTRPDVCPDGAVIVPRLLGRLRR